MADIRLSICIPTYNFGKFIGETLDSITKNLTDGVEVVILDGGSVDDTCEVVAKRQVNYPQIKYYNQGYKGGIDKDIAKTVSLAEGTYCWLFSADDLMKPGAVSKLLYFMESGCDIYLCEQTACDFEMHPTMEWPIFRRIRKSEIFDLKDISERERYFTEARTSEAFFSYLAGPIFRKEIWKMADGIPESFYGTCWGIAGRLLSLFPSGFKIHYIGESLIYKRGTNKSGENTSFHDRGVVNLFRMSVEGYTHIAETIFGINSFEAFHIQRVLRNEWSFKSLLYLKLAVSINPMREDINILKRVAEKHYKNAGIINKFKYELFLVIPVSVIKHIRILKRLVSGISNKITGKNKLKVV